MSTAEAVNDDEFLAQLYKGGELLAAGKVDEAKGHLEKAHSLRPKNEKAQNLLGLTYFKLGKFEQAANIYEALVRENPVDPTLRVNLGLVYLKWNLLDKSVKEFETATDLQPDHKKAHNYLGLALAQANDYARAREHFLIAGSESMADKMAKAMVSAEPPPMTMRATMEIPAVIIPPPPPPAVAAPEPSPAAPSLPHDEPLAPPAVPDEPPHMHRTREARPMETVEPPPDARPSRPSEDAEIEVMSEEDMVPPDAEELPPEPLGAEPRPTFKPPTSPEPLSADWGAQFGIDTPPGADELPVLEAQPVIEATVEEMVEVESGLPVAATAEAEAPAWSSSGPVDEALSQQQLPSWVTDTAPTNGNGNGHSHDGPDPTGGWSAVPPSDDVLMQQAGAVDPSVTEPPPPVEESAMVVTQGDPYASQPVPITAPTEMSDEMDFSSANPEDSGNASSVSVDPALMAETGYSTSPAPEVTETPVEEPAPAFEAAEMTYRPAASFDGEETYVPKGEDPRPDPFAGHGVELQQVPEVEPPPMPPNVPVVTVDPDEDSLPPVPMSSAPRPGFVPVEVPRLVDLGPSLDYGQSPKQGPFHVGPEGLALSVEGELLSRLTNVVAVVGSVEAAPERRRFRGRASEEPFGEGASQVQRLTGNGVVYLEAAGAHFQAIDLDDEGIYLREERCFAFEEVVAFENGKLSGENVTVPLVNLKGHGRVLLRLDGPLKAIAVPPGSPLKVPLVRLVGWYGRVSPKVIGFVGQTALELTGDGYALLSRG